MNLLNVVIVILFAIALFNSLRLVMMMFGSGLSPIGYRNLALSLLVLTFSACQLFGWFNFIQFVTNYIKK